MKLNKYSIENEKLLWERANIKLPAFDIDAMCLATKKNPEWVHFGAGNIFRGFIGSIAQRLLESGAMKSGIVACDTFDYDIIDGICAKHDQLTLNVTLNGDGTTSSEVLAGVAESIKADFSNEAGKKRLFEIFETGSLKMVSFTITEKGYQTKGPDGSLLKIVADDIENGPNSPRHAMSIVASLLYHRFLRGGQPLTLVSMDNCSHNGEKLRNAVLAVAKAWVDNGKADGRFYDYVSNEKIVSFPWTMIDKITPRPHAKVEEMLVALGVEDIAPIVTSRKTYIAPFVNAEKAQYLVVEDRFANGKLPLDKAGVYMTDRQTVNKAEKMKVTTCLNPLHTAMSMFGCLLGYTLICDEMRDGDIVALVKRLGYIEGLPVVIDPGIIAPKTFLDEVVNERLPNPFMPDDPRRIATDTSQKVGIRFGETIKSYIASNRSLDDLVALPLAIAAWLRYLLAKDDNGNDIEVSADPLKEELQRKLSAVQWNNAGSCRGEVTEILANETIFGLNIAQTSLAPRIEQYFKSMLAGPGSVRAALKIIK